MIGGCFQSKLDGTEAKYEANRSTFPIQYSYEKILPSVINQGEDSICVPCSLSAFLNWDCNVSNKAAGKDNKIHLQEIYNIREKKISGMTIKEGLSYLKNHGVSSNKGLLKIDKYAKIGTISALKSALIANGPCLGHLPINSDSDYFWRGSDYKGGHAVAIIGYNKKGFIIRNSWGTQFGQNGNVVLPYEDFSSFKELWTIIN